MRLALENPDSVIFVRGNHEDINLNYRSGFREEISNKFNDADLSKHKKINRMNDFLPVVLYIGCHNDKNEINYLQCCHGGLELGYDPRDFLDNETKPYQLIEEPDIIKQIIDLKQAITNHHNCSHMDYLKELETIHAARAYNRVESCQDLGFLWTDFNVLNTNQMELNHARKSDKLIIYGKYSTQDILAMQSSAKSHIRGILRAHQHTTTLIDPMMNGIVQSKGVYKLWNPIEKTQKRFLTDGLVWTFNVGADSAYGQGCGFKFDTYAAITTAVNYDQWTMELFNLDLII